MNSQKSRCSAWTKQTHILTTQRLSGHQQTHFGRISLLSKRTVTNFRGKLLICTLVLQFLYCVVSAGLETLKINRGFSALYTLNPTCVSQHQSHHGQRDCPLGIKECCNERDFHPIMEVLFLLAKRHESLDILDITYI